MQKNLSSFAPVAPACRSRVKVKVDESMTERIELPPIEFIGIIARRLVRGMPMPVRALSRVCAPLSSAQSTWGGKGGRGWDCLGCSILSPVAFEARLPSPSAMVVASRRGQRRLPGREGALRVSNPLLAIATAAMPVSASDVRLSSPWRGGSRVAGPGGPQVSRRNSNPPHTRACARTRHPPTRTRPLLTTHTHTHTAQVPPPLPPPQRRPHTSRRHRARRRCCRRRHFYCHRR